MVGGAELERSLQARPEVADCAVLERAVGDANESIAFVVAAPTYDPERIQSDLLEAHGVMPVAVVRVESIPFRDDGRVDEAQLLSLPAVDPSLLGACEASFAEVDGVDSVRAYICELERPSPRIHLSRLGLTRGHGTDRRARPDPDAGRPPASRGMTPDDRPALSEGGDARTPTQKNLPDLLAWAVTHGAGTLIFHEEDGSVVTMSYPDLARASGRVLRGLRMAGADPGDRIVLQLGSRADFLKAFWGAVLGGFVPVPVPEPAAGVSVGALDDRAREAWELTGRPLVLRSNSTPAGGRTGDEPRIVGLSDFSHLEPDTDWASPDVGETALIMMTSGSTGAPKGVMQTHESLVAEAAESAHHLEMDGSDKTLNWMPLEHVGGLLMTHLRDVYLGAGQVQVGINLVLEDPLLWWDMVDRYRCTATWAPNFAFALVNDRAEDMAGRGWDLRCMRNIVNGGEAIVARTARRFVALMSPFGMPEGAMRPAWGMSETSSGVTYSKSFSLDTVHDDDPHVALGPPIRGVAIRIADDSDRMLPEAAIGHVQISGRPVTKGYYEMPEATGASFTEDGWFRTGDLGCLNDGRLTLTGRAKDMIIVNGINFGCHEIEATVDEVTGIVPSFTAACSVRVGAAETDQLAVFFVMTDACEAEPGPLLREVQRRLAEKVGLQAEFLVPVSRDRVPKTDIGKIQRSALARALEAGDFDDEVVRADLFLENRRTLPDWFLEKVWIRRDQRQGEQMPEGVIVAFAHPDGVGAVVDDALSRGGARVILVGKGAGFRSLSGDRFEVDANDPDSFRMLAEQLRGSGELPSATLFLWPAEEGSDPSRLTGTRESQALGALGLTYWLQALAADPGTTPVSHQVVVGSRGLQCVRPEDEVDPGWAPLIGLASSVALEYPGFSARVVDFDARGEPDPAGEARRLCEEVVSPGMEVQIAYRKGQRWVRRLRAAQDVRRGASGTDFVQGGAYLVIGGLGAVGREVSRRLVSEFEARLLVVGRSEAPAADDGRPGMEALGPAARYAALDLANRDELVAAVDAAEQAWGRTLDGVLHMADSFDQRLIQSESRASYDHSMAAKLYGMDGIGAILATRPHCDFVGFSSAMSFYGGPELSAYSGANCALETTVEAMPRPATARRLSLAWSLWGGGMGLSAGWSAEVASAKGFLSIQPEQGWLSLRAALRYGRSLTVGMDVSNSFVRRHVVDPVAPSDGLAAVYVPSGDGAAPGRLTALVEDRFGVGIPAVAVPGTSLPRVTRRGRLEEGWAGVGDTRPVVPPRTDVERRIGNVWASVLGLSRVSVDESFFALGGDSLKATQLVSRVRNEFGVTLALSRFLSAPTISDLAIVVTEVLETAESDDLVLRPVSRRGRRVTMPASGVPGSEGSR